MGLRKNPELLIGRRFSPEPRSSGGAGRDALVLGGGPVGLLAALYLARRGYAVRVSEKRPERDSGALWRNVILFYRGLKALCCAGIEREQIERCGLLVDSHRFHLKDREIHRPFVAPCFALDRSRLVELLLESARASGVSVSFEERVTALDPLENTAQISNAQGTRSERAELIVVADGAYSLARHSLLARTRRFGFAQHFHHHGYKTLVLSGERFPALDRSAVHFFREHGKYVMHASFIDAATLVCTIVMPYDGPEGLYMQERAACERFFASYVAEIHRACPEVVDRFLEAPPRDFITVDCSRFDCGPGTVVLGDAAHATVPFAGQGLNCGLEDAFELNRALDERRDALTPALAAYSARRKPEVDAMQEISLDHYRFLTQFDPVYLLRMEFARVMHERFPRLYPMDLKTVLSFTDVPYSQVLSMMRTQNRWYRIGRL